MNIFPTINDLNYEGRAGVESTARYQACHYYAREISWVVVFPKFRSPQLHGTSES